MKNFFSNFKIYLIIFLFSIIFTVIIFEIYSSYRKDLFPSYGWQTDNIMKNKIKKCNHEKNIGVFGDSFVEYYGEDKANIVEILDNKFINYNLCNFGLSGTDTTHYIDRFLFTLENNIKMEKVIFYLYEGNDFSDFRYSKIDKIKYNSKNIIDRNLSLPKKIVKSTNSLNIIYREVIKKYFFKNRINEAFVKNLYNKKNKYFEVPYENALERVNDTPNEYKKLFSADILNINFYALALRNPNYFKEIFDGARYDQQSKITFKHLDFLNDLCKKNNLDCKIIIIPNDEFLFIEAKKKYSDVFRFNYHKNFGKSKIVKEILNKYENIFYPENIFEYEDYIANDMHLTASGNQKLAKFTFNLISNQ
jgi:hypothetical protein